MWTCEGLDGKKDEGSGIEGRLEDTKGAVFSVTWKRLTGGQWERHAKVVTVTLSPVNCAGSCQ